MEWSNILVAGVIYFKHNAGSNQNLIVTEKVKNKRENMEYLRSILKHRNRVNIKNSKDIFRDASNRNITDLTSLRYRSLRSVVQ